MKSAKHKIAALFLIPVLMFGFGYLLVPIYDVICDWTGLNGKTGSLTITRVSKMKPDPTRLIKVEFMANRNQLIPLAFTPAVRSMLVHPGKPYQTTYHARSLRDVAMVGQAVPSVSPSKAAAYFNKTECFCFGRQAFAAHQTRELPLVFVIHPNLPRDIQTITLSYTFFEVEPTDADADADADQVATPTADTDAHDHAGHDHDHADHADHDHPNAT